MNRRRAPRGYVTLATGDARYVEMAVDLALSLRAWDALPVALVGDESALTRAAATYPDVFDQLTLLDRRYHGPQMAKYGVAGASPFEESLYLDADCLVLSSLLPAWDDVTGSGFALVGEMLDTETAEGEVHHGFPVPHLLRYFGSSRYLKNNSGVLYFDAETGPSVMDECLTCHRDQVLAGLRGGFLGDEIALAVVGARRGLSTFATSPMMWGHELAVLDPAAPTKPVCHFISPIPRDTTDALVAQAERRRAERGLPSNGGAHWRWKERRARRAGNVERILRPFLGVARALRLRATRPL